jgi:hypothetical protein
MTRLNLRLDRLYGPLDERAWPFQFQHLRILYQVVRQLVLYGGVVKRPVTERPNFVAIYWDMHADAFAAFADERLANMVFVILSVERAAV